MRAREGTDTRFLHGDLIGSTMLTTGESGTAVSAVSYTAFGEAIGDAAALGTRYQYAGAWGYEADLLALAGANEGLAPITLQHVGHRWYQPDIGRFVQRDPIGVFGSLNVYAYCEDSPLLGADPLGLAIDLDDLLNDFFIGVYGAAGALIGSAAGPKGTVVGAGVGAVYGETTYDGLKKAPAFAICIWDIGEALCQLDQNNAKNRGQRGRNPEVWPPAPRGPVVDPPDCFTPSM